MDITTNTTTDNTTDNNVDFADIDIERFVDRYVAVWNEPDPVARRSALGALWDVDAVETTETARYEGHEALEARVAGAHNSLVRDAGYVFLPAGDTTAHHGTILFTIHMVPEAGGDIAWIGRVVLTLGGNGLIQYDRQFTQELPKEKEKATAEAAVQAAAGTRATTEEFLRRLGEGAPDRIAETFAESVDWQLDWPDSGHPAVPWIRPRSTRPEVADHFRDIAAFHVPEKSAGTVFRILVDGADAVVLGDIRQTVRATGEPYTALCALHLTVKDGLITRYAVYEDSLTVAGALAGRPLLG